MKRSAKVWLKGLVAAVVTAAANSVATGLGAMSLAPEQFNMNGGMVMTLKLVAVTAIVSAIMGAAMYLKQSPIPPDDTVDLPMLPPAAVLLLVCSTLYGCGGPFKAAVAVYTSTLQQRGALYYGAVEPELRKELVLNDASLVCLVDEDSGSSSDEKLTPACACSKGKPDDWEINCAGWIGSSP